MTWAPDRYRALRRLLRRDALEEEVEEELGHHLAQLADDLQAAGLTEEEAIREAARRFGDKRRYAAEVQAVMVEAHRSVRRRERVLGALTDLTTTARSLRRRPGFSLSVLATLALALAGTAVTLTLVDSILLRPLAYPSPDELVVVRHPVPAFGEFGSSEWGLSVAGYFHFADNNRSLDELGVWTGGNVNLAGDQGAERALAAFSTASLLRVLDATPLFGRLFVDADNEPDAPSVAILTHALWVQRYGSDPAAVGRTIMVNSRPVEIVGVLPPDFHHPLISELIWLPLRLDRAARPVNSHFLSAIGRLGPGVEVETAQAELRELTSTFPDVFPEAYSHEFMERYGFDLSVRSLKSDVIGDARRVLWIVLAVSLLVLFVAGANTVGMFLVRADARRHEMAIRTSLGADKSRLLWHAASEPLVLTGLSVGVGLAAATLVLRVISSLELESLTRATPPWVSVRALLLVGLLGLGVASVISLLTRILPSTPTQALRGGGATGTPRPRRLLREGMMVAQVAAALVIATGAGLLFRSAINLGKVEPGIETEDVWFADVALPALRYSSYADVSRFFEELARRLEAEPSIQRVGFTNEPPFSGLDGCSLIFIENRPPEVGGRPPCVATPQVSPGYLEALGVAVDGRTPRWASEPEGEVVVSRAFADRFWPGQDPIGRGVRGNGEEPPFYRVVGVAANMRADGLDRPVEEAVYFPLLPLDGASLWSPPRSATLVVAGSAVSTGALASLLRTEVTALDPEVPVANVRSVESVISKTTAHLTFATALISVGAVLSLFLAAMGLYGLFAYLVGNREEEIGVRMALGATGGDILRMIMGRALLITGIGVGLGLIADVLLADSLSYLLFEVRTLDPTTLLAATAVLLGIGAAASLVPARRATAVDPVAALRSE